MSANAADANMTGSDRVETEVFGGDPEDRRPVAPAIMAGVKGRCPNCGEGRMFGKWLKVSPQCSSCGEELHHERAQDFPPYITLFIVGHVVVTLLMLVEARFTLSLPAHLAIWLPMAIIMSVAMMQPVKGGVVGLQWALRMFGFGDNPEDA